MQVLLRKLNNAFISLNMLPHYWTYQFHRIGPTISPVLIRLFIHPLRVFVEIGSLVFSDFLHEVRGL